MKNIKNINIKSKYKVPVPLPKYKGKTSTYPSYRDPSSMTSQHYTFEDTLKYSIYHKWDSSMKIFLVSLTSGVEYNLSCSEFFLTLNKMEKGVVSGTWRWLKKGTSYSLTLVD